MLTAFGLLDSLEETIDSIFHTSDKSVKADPFPEVEESLELLKNTLRNNIAVTREMVVRTYDADSKPSVEITGSGNTVAGGNVYLDRTTNTPSSTIDTAEEA